MRNLTAYLLTTAACLFQLQPALAAQPVPMADSQADPTTDTGVPTPGPSSVESEAPMTGSGDIIVTARRRAESIQNVPVAVSAFSEDTIVKLRVTDTNSLSKLSAGLSVKPTFANRDTATPVIRAQGTSFGTGQNSVIPYFAEAPNFDIRYYDLANLQVLKGPQGTLFGETATGGVLLYEPTRPKNEFGGYLRFEKGNYDYTSIEGAIGGPIIDDVLMVRLAGQYRKRSGFTTAYSSKPGVPTQNIDNIDNLNLRLSVLFKPTDWLSIYTVGVRNQNESYTPDAQIYTVIAGRAPILNFTPAQSYPLLGVSSAQGLASYAYYAGNPPPPGQTWLQLQQAALANQQQLGPRATATIFDHSRSIIYSGLVNQIAAEITPQIVLKNIFSIQRTKGRGALTGVNGSALPLYWNNGYTCLQGVSADDCRVVTARQWTNETQFQGNFLDDRLNVQAGFYYRKNPFADYVPAGQGIVVFGTLNQMPASAAYCTGLGVAAGTQCSPLTRTSSQSKALYGQATFAITQKLRFTAGYRSIWDSAVSENAAGRFFTTPFTYNNVTYNLPLAVAGTPVLPGTTTRRLKVPTSQHGIYSLALDWRITPDTLLYVSHATGYKGGGINQFLAPGDANRTFGPETVKSYEIGAKGKFNLGGITLRPTLALYRNDYSDIQRTVQVPGTINTIVSNLANGRIQGIEFETAAQFGRYFDINAYYAYTDGKFTKWTENTVCSNLGYAAPVCAGLDSTTPLVVDHVAGTFSAGGRVSTFKPDVMANVQKHRWGLRPTVSAGLIDPSLENVSLSANLYYQSKSVTEEVNFSKVSDPSILRIPAQTYLDLTMNWNQINGSRIDAYLSVTNVTKKLYPLARTLIADSIGQGFQIYNEPRVFVAGVRMDF